MIFNYKKDIHIVIIISQKKYGESVLKYKFLKMNKQRNDVCPLGYVWITNISSNCKYSFIDALFNKKYFGDFFQRTKDMYRKLYGDVQVCSPAYDNTGNELEKDTVALYVPHPAVRRMQRWLRNHNKMKGGNLPY